MKKIFFFLLSILILLSSVSVTLIIYLIRDLPNPESFDARQVAQTTKIYDRAGEVLLYEIYGEERRTIVPFSEIPDYVKQATVAIEDAEFYQHSALDWRGIVRALLTNLRSRQIIQGGSTITQQLAKNAFLSSERTVTRKVKELVLAYQLEKRYTKDKILDLYLNQIPYGSNSYGIEAAAQTFFNKSAKELTLAEAALLAGLPKAPSYFSPYGAHVAELLKRKDLTLQKMADLSFVAEKEKESAQKTNLKFAPQAQGIKAPHFVITVQDYLINRYGEDFVRKSGLKVITTLDWPMQEVAEKAVSEGAKKNTELYEGKNAALVAQDPQTGQVLALVGSKDYFDTANDGNFNVATQGLRQPGSAIKPFAYVTAFKKGYTPDTIIWDLETEFDTTGEEEKNYKPQNFDEQFRGPITFRQGLAQSINVPSVKVLYLAGIDNTLKTASDFGVTTLTERSRYGLSLALGGGEVKLIDLVGAYSVFSQNGIKHDQSLILKITDSGGRVLEEYQNKSARVIDEQYPRLINDILSDTEARRPLFQNSFHLTVFPNHEFALKTGTTNDYRDAWAIGYTPSIVVGVWAGNNDNQSMQKRGSSILAAVPIWHDFLSQIIDRVPPEIFPRPEPIITNKPILNGQYIINNQVHDTLYYVSKNNPQGPAPTDPTADSQFENWEKPVLEWLQKNPDRIAALNNLSGIELISPKNGGFVENNFNVNFKVKNDDEITKMEIYLNNQLIEQKLNNFGKEFNYQTTISADLNLQNGLKIKIYAAGNQSLEKEVILFKK